jgi:two-component system sensor histidine kinase FlrB
MGAQLYMSKDNQEQQPEVQDLESAFRTFSQMSEQLVGAYKNLEGRVGELNQELAQAHDQRLEELQAKEILAGRLQCLLNAMPAGVVVLDGNGMVQDCNPTAVALLGEPLEQQAWIDVVQRSFAPRDDDGSDISLQDGRRVSLSTSSMGDEPGQILVLHDVTETRALRDRLEQHKRLSAMGQMAASLAHQIRTPLSSSMLYVSQLGNPKLDADKKQQFADKTLAGLKQLEGLINDMLLFAKGGGANGKQAIPVDELLKSLERSMAPIAEQAGARLQLVNELPNTSIEVNRDAMLGALQNLINNAIEACQQECVVTVLARRGPVQSGIDTADFRVIDTGPGISEQEQQHIFEPFITSKTRGTGLGLAVVQAVARAHNGTAWLESEAGKGSTFGLLIPLVAANNQMMSGTKNTTGSGDQE